MDLGRSQDKSISEIAGNLTSAAQRYWRIALAPSIIMFGLTVMVAYIVPNYFSSDALLVVRPQQISSKILDEPNKEETRERLESLIQEVLSRPRLRSVLERFNMYPKLRGPAGMEQAVKKFRNKITIKPAVSTTGGQDLYQTFQLSFTHQDPHLAYDVTKALADLFIEESVLEKRSEIQSTEEFIDAQLRDARKKLEETEQQVQVFVSANVGKLPEHLSSSVARLESMQNQLSNNTQLLSAAILRRSALAAEMGDAQREGSSTEFTGNSNDPGESLAQLESALVVLQSKYSEQHPDVINTKRRIQALKQQLSLSGGAGKGKSTLAAGNSKARTVRNSIAEVDAQIDHIRAENERLKIAVEQLQDNIAAIPMKEQDLLKINRDYTNVKDTYQRLLAAKEEASLKNSLIRSQKDAQFKIVEPAELPAIPAGPNRLLIAGSGLAVSTALFVGLMFMMYLFNSSFKNRDEVEEETDIPVIGIIPPMETTDAILQGKKLVRASLAASVFSLVSGCALIYVVFHYVIA